MSASDEPIHVIDPEGEVIIYLRRPDRPFAPWDYNGNRGAGSPTEVLTSSPAVENTESNNSVDEVYSIDSSRGQVGRDSGPQTVRAAKHVEKRCHRIQVSAKQLKLLSPVFKEALSCLLASGVGVEITTGPFDLEPFLLLMKIFHCQPQNFPQRVSLEVLAQLAVMADHYQCRAWIQFFADRWIRDMDPGFPTAYCRDAMLWVWVSWFFKLPAEFEKSTALVVDQSDRLVTRLGLPIPAVVIDLINRTRSLAIYRMIEQMNLRRDYFLTGARGCSYECSSIMLGALTRNMHAIDLYPEQPGDPYTGMSRNKLIEKVRSFTVSRYCSTSRVQHKCGMKPFPEIIKKAGAVKGIDLDMFKLG
ncbi:hypothetical protein P168DRAFT_234322 [Aspergillus campestris IBT 28561]|uniref:BTB domain-containing protein n=1 Tax=Aspergillus campestris (strain IBT 28561) TaxID=1392248 RepID=A0A2I1D5K5_ASPC2|nr:uncharacterized protein P168DRAFT_234322 [Aspergillus campestris IBT 28561]PKY05155.1 hypothetical protein P168DRAFT_234322 [Aspergillus campestris IBT 28561]